jgi:NitT/TauT family transport system permease protein
MAATDTREIDRLASGLDALELPVAPRERRVKRLWDGAWPKLLAVALFFGVWEFLVLVGWKQEFNALPTPEAVFNSLTDNWSTIWDATLTTLSRAAQGYALALLIGTTIGAIVARSRVLRAGVGAMITGLQTMPSVAWYPLALLLFKLSEGAILFVVVLGASPAIANGLISGIDTIQPVLLRAGRVLGARRWAEFRWVTLPAAFPSFVGGLKQGWAFAWRSLLAGEVIGGITGYSLGQQLQANRDFGDSAGIVAVMLVIFVIGVVMDIVVFGNLERWVRRRHGLADGATGTAGSRSKRAATAATA